LFNPHGIDYKVRPMPFSTAEDMARLTRYAMNKRVSVFMYRKRSVKFRSIAPVIDSIMCFAIRMNFWGKTESTESRLAAPSGGRLFNSLV
jgi:hypothetical protein